MYLINAHLQKIWLRNSVQCAPNVGSQRNLGKLVVVALVVLGLETAEVLVTQNSITRGTMACSPVRHGHSRR